MAIHCRLSTILGERRLKQSEVARDTGIHRNTINALYWDRWGKVDYAILDKLCKYLKVQPGDLLVYVENGGVRQAETAPVNNGGAFAESSPQVKRGRKDTAGN